ncbi:transposase [Thiolapillus brandeum]|uniref:transposase n=1 Tax=Thiolapillus brandeum TaxID=1076588 RepID=UPI00155ACCF8
MFADCTSAHQWWTNQFLLLLSSLAYVRIEAIRRFVLHDTELAYARAGTLRLKLLTRRPNMSPSVLQTGRVSRRGLQAMASPCQKPQHRYVLCLKHLTN